MLKAGILGLLVTGAAVAAFAPAPSLLSYVPESFDYDPPVPLHVWVTKLPTPLRTGENVMMRVEFADRDSMPAILPVYLTDHDSVQFRDDGVAPDDNAEDLSYAAYVTEEIDGLVEHLSSVYSAFEEQGHLLKFTGHAGQQVDELPPFEASHFLSGEETEIPLDIVWVKKPWCGWAKEKTLFITDLSVVEDPTRTYDVYNSTGTQMGAWTFGKLVQNMVNTSSTGVTAKDFLKSWLLNWTQQQTINGQTVATREGIVLHLIEPWLRKCDNTITAGSVTISNWQSLWNQTSVTEAELLQYAPFKLTAIVNRLDLRAGNIYKKIVSNSGETRFIFTALDPFSTVPISTNPNNPSQRPPQHRDPGDINMLGAEHQPEVIDWQGFNVIFEYANVATNHCQLRQLAWDWVNLNALTLGSSGFNSALQAITDQVTTTNAKPGWANGSAIRSIRTNERTFASLPTNPNPGYCGQAAGPSIINLQATWKLNDWELRQFGLNPISHLLQEVVVENTPVAEMNCQENLSLVSPCTTAFCSPSALAPQLGDWVVAHQSQVALGRHQLPATLPGQIAMLAASSIVSGDFAHYQDIDWTALPSMPSNGRVLRQQLSLNTCGGCHGGETQTLFAHVLPTVSGESAKYWQASTPPDTKEAIADWKNSPTNVNGNFPFPANKKQHWVTVSAFLTGRNYSGPANDPQSLPTYDDADPNDAGDDGIDGLFQVTDPVSNSPFANGVNYQGTMLFGYNDLERRRQDLCNLVNSDCELLEAPVIKLMKQLTFNVLPKGAH